MSPTLIVKRLASKYSSRGMGVKSAVTLEQANYDDILQKDKENPSFSFPGMEGA